MSTIILLAASFPAELKDRITGIAGNGPRCRVAGPFDPPTGAALSPGDAAAVRVLVTMGTLRTDAEVMARLPSLGLICCYGTGYEGVDLEEARKRGIMVTHSPAANAPAVADHAMALLLAAGRRIALADRFVRDGLWSGHSAARMPLVRGLTGRRIGVFGFGAIGRRIAARAAAFEAEVAYHNRSRKPDVPYAFHDTLESLADWADVLMIAARADAGNRHRVGREVMKALGPDGIVVNIARGSIVDQEALIDLLRSGELGGAGLDVFEHEPAVPDALRAIPHAVLTPHIGGGTHEAHEAMQGLVAANVAAFLAGAPVVTPVPEMA
ncbi:2-hydroxyacid dehydrogenase [Skermanella sp. TT6]|uniref:2-hydroxyacid dehydrogenase n=1 Tax=Skermanella cutis TaxID=2775420 RepID=A0ABX7BA50_9PROT|nr:2-hydroxyacid dehydrogenase [Skermanella sp. TT6]QQP91241.1 2-hydroxyacid dehydrogenase [Skermanella sp. TT6]